MKGYNGDGSREYEDIRSLEKDFATFKAWWIQEINKLRNYIKIEIGVRNNKIKELSTRIAKIEQDLGHIAYLSYVHKLEQRIETLEQTLEELK